MRIPLTAPSGSSVQRALNNAWLREQGVPDLKAGWIELHYGGNAANRGPSFVQAAAMMPVVTWEAVARQPAAQRRAGGIA